MAQTVFLRHPRTGLTKNGFIGFSWTTFFFGGTPALFRGDIVIGSALFVVNIFTFGIAGMIWAFFYNKSYTTRLIERGYQLADTEELNALARMKLGISEPSRFSVLRETGSAY
ncbi:MAG: hypothetical protein ACRC7G_03420 [Beijerinckiaceae bacterium]